MYEAKFVHQFDHRWATYEEDRVGSRDVSLADKQNPNFFILPRYWIPQTEVEERLSAKGWNRGWLLGWRDICRSTDERTVIGSILPLSGTNFTLRILVQLSANQEQVTCLLGSLNSMVVDYCARQKVGSRSVQSTTYSEFVPAFSLDLA